MTLIRTAVISIFLFAIVVFLLAVNDKKLRELVSNDMLKPTLTQPAQTPTPDIQQVTFPDVIPLSELGDFNIKKVKKKKIIKKKEVKARKKILARKKIFVKTTPKPKSKPQRVAVKDSTEPVQSIAVPKTRTKRTRPQFQLGYNEIGLEVYLQVVERIGTLHLVLSNGGKPRYGPAISFIKRKISTDELDQKNLAVERPYSVTDRELPRYLGLFTLPLGSLKGQLVLFLNKSFDRLLWNTLTAKLSKKNYGLSDIASVNGQYIREAQHIIIRIEKAKAKAGETILIDTYLDVPCNLCT